MRIFLAIILLLNSYVAVGGAELQCETPAELMAANVNAKDFSSICQTMIEQDEGWKKLKPEKKMSCQAKEENEILSTSDLLSKAGQCIKGFAWDSMVDLGKFVLDLIKTLVGAHISTVSGMIRFLSDSEYALILWDIVSSDLLNGIGHEFHERT